MIPFLSLKDVTALHGDEIYETAILVVNIFKPRQFGRD